MSNKFGDVIMDRSAVTRFLTTSKRLIELLRQEITAIRARDFMTVASILEEEMHLCDEIEDFHKLARNEPAFLSNISEELSDELIYSGNLFTELLREKESVLDDAFWIHGKIMEHLGRVFDSSYVSYCSSGKKKYVGANLLRNVLLLEQKI